MPTSRQLLTALVAIVGVAGAALADDTCLECKASACMFVFQDEADRSHRDEQEAALASWDEIEAKGLELDAANAEHDVVLASLEAAREARVAAAYDELRLCLEP